MPIDDDRCAGTVADLQRPRGLTQPLQPRDPELEEERKGPQGRNRIRISLTFQSFFPFKIRNRLKILNGAADMATDLAYFCAATDC